MASQVSPAGTTVPPPASTLDAGTLEYKGKVYKATIVYTDAHGNPANAPTGIDTNKVKLLAQTLLQASNLSRSTNFNNSIIDHEGIKIDGERSIPDRTLTYDRNIGGSISDPTYSATYPSATPIQPIWDALHTAMLTPTTTTRPSSSPSPSPSASPTTARVDLSRTTPSWTALASEFIRRFEREMHASCMDEIEPDQYKEDYLTGIHNILHGITDVDNRYLDAQKQIHTARDILGQMATDHSISFTDLAKGIVENDNRLQLEELAETPTPTQILGAQDEKKHIKDPSHEDYQTYLDMNELQILGYAARNR